MVNLNFQPFPELKTGQLLLRRMSEADAGMLFILRSDPRVMQYIGRERPKDVQDVLDLIRLINKNLDENKAIMWAIASKEDPAKMIGNITLWQIQPEHARAELGYLLHPDHWRKGIMRNSIQQVIRYAFETMRLHSIEARMDSRNRPSALLLESVGFVKEGYFKEDFYFQGKYYDTSVYSLLNAAES